MKRMWVAGIASLLVLAAAGVGGWWWWKSRRTAPTAVKAAPPDPYKLLPPGSEVNLSGKIEAQKVVGVAPPIEGTLGEFFVETGQEVLEGQLLARVDNAGLAAAKEAAEAEVEKVQNRVENLEGLLADARLEASRARALATTSGSERDRLQRIYERQKVLIAEGATPRRIFEKSQSDYTKAKADADSLESLARTAEDRAAALQRDVDNTRKLLADKQQDAENTKAHLEAGEVHSPVEGIVVGRRGQAGDAVNPEMKDLFQIAVDLTQLKVVLAVEPMLAQRLRGGEAALVQVLELQTPPQPGQVKEVKGDQVTLEFATPDPQVKPGINAQVRIRLN